MNTDLSVIEINKCAQILRRTAKPFLIEKMKDKAQTRLPIPMPLLK